MLLDEQDSQQTEESRAIAPSSPWQPQPQSSSRLESRRVSTAGLPEGGPPLDVQGRVPPGPEELRGSGWRCSFSPHGGGVELSSAPHLGGSGEAVPHRLSLLGSAPHPCQGRSPASRPRKLLGLGSPRLGSGFPSLGRTFPAHVTPSTRTTAPGAAPPGCQPRTWRLLGLPLLRLGLRSLRAKTGGLVPLPNAPARKKGGGRRLCILCILQRTSPSSFSGGRDPPTPKPKMRVPGC